MRKLVARLSIDTVTRHVRNADPLRPNDLHNGRSSIPIARSSPYRGHILPEGRNDVCGSERPRGSCFWRSLCGKREAICFTPSVRNYGAVGGKHWQAISHSMGDVTLLDRPRLLRSVSRADSPRINYLSRYFVFLSKRRNVEANTLMNSLKNIIHLIRDYPGIHSLAHKKRQIPVRFYGA